MLKLHNAGDIRVKFQELSSKWQIIDYVRYDALSKSEIRSTIYFTKPPTHTDRYMRK